MDFRKHQPRYRLPMHPHARRGADGSRVRRQPVAASLSRPDRTSFAGPQDGPVPESGGFTGIAHPTSASSRMNEGHLMARSSFVKRLLRVLGALSSGAGHEKRLSRSRRFAGLENLEGRALMATINASGVITATPAGRTSTTRSIWRTPARATRASARSGMPGSPARISSPAARSPSARPPAGRTPSSTRGPAMVSPSSSSQMRLRMTCSRGTH